MGGCGSRRAIIWGRVQVFPARLYIHFEKVGLVTIKETWSVARELVRVVCSNNWGMIERSIGWLIVVDEDVGLSIKAVWVFAEEAKRRRLHIGARGGRGVRADIVIDKEIKNKCWEEDCGLKWYEQEDKRKKVVMNECEWT